MRGGPVLLVMAGLLALLLLEFGLAFTAVPRPVLPAIGLCMALLVALTFMRLPAAGALAGIFAAAGVFWLCVMMGLGSLDPATRTDIPVSRTDVHPAAGGLPPARERPLPE